MTLTDLAQLEVTCDVAEADVGAIHQGQTGTVSLDALTGQEFAATVASVAPIGTTSSDVVTYPVTMTLEDPSSAVKPGMSANVTIVTSSVDDALAVPSSAVSGGGKTGTVTVRSAKGVETRVPVVVELVGTSTTAVYGDLSVGETVVLPSVSISPSSTAASSGSPSGTLGGASSDIGGLTRLGGGGGVGGFGGGGGFGGAGGFRGAG
jgi:multidrug efflux pump subunit AcrA (membrane-fusion protein)